MDIIDYLAYKIHNTYYEPYGLEIIIYAINVSIILIYSMTLTIKIPFFYTPLIPVPASTYKKNSVY